MICAKTPNLEISRSKMALLGAARKYPSDMWGRARPDGAFHLQDMTETNI